LKETALDNEKFEKIADNGHRSYFWSMTCTDSLSLLIKENENIILEINLDYFQFNELLYSIYQTLILAIGLQNLECEFVHFLLNENRDFVALTKIENFKQILVNTNFEKDTFKFFVFYNHYLDILFILYKVKKFCNFALLPNNLESILHI